MFIKTGILKDKTKAYDIFNACISNDFTTIPSMKSSEYIKFCWGKYKAYCTVNPQDKALNGNIFELIVESELYRKSICPMFLQARVAFVPNINFDVLLYSSEQFPIGLSLKTSLRERYKQADLEALALKNVHRKALTYLITLNSQESISLKAKVDNEELLGINRVIDADKDEFDALIAELAGMRFINPGEISIIMARNIVEK